MTARMQHVCMSVALNVASFLIRESVMRRVAVETVSYVRQALLRIINWSGCKQGGHIQYGHMGRGLLAPVWGMCATR